MEDKNIIFYDRAKQIWQEIAKQEPYKPLDFQIEIHKKLLNFFQAGDYYYFIFNVRGGEFEYISHQIKSILGFDCDIKADEFLSRIHPDDQFYFIEFEKKLHYFFRQLSLDQITKYKVQYHFRIKDNHQKYRRILHQLVIIEFDNDKNLLRSLGVHTDMSHLIPEDAKPKLSFIGLEGEPSFYDVSINATLPVANNLFSRREKQVLRLVLSGQNTSEIAKSLNLSVHTINSHRKSIFFKSGCNSLVELGAKTIREAWL